MLDLRVIERFYVQGYLLAKTAKKPPPENKANECCIKHKCYIHHYPKNGNMKLQITSLVPGTVQLYALSHLNLKPS